MPIPIHLAMCLKNVKMGNNDEIATTARSKFMLRTLVFAVQVIVFHNLLEPSIYSGFNIPYLEHSRNSCKHF